MYKKDENLFEIDGVFTENFNPGSSLNNSEAALIDSSSSSSS
jgi:hypothetical protein